MPKKLWTAKVFIITNDYFEKIVFYRDEKKASIYLNKFETGEAVRITFLNVAGFQMASCDFWGASGRVANIDYVDEKNRVLLPKLYEEDEKYQCLKDPDEYIEICMLFISGDTLRIVCEKIETD